MSRYLVISFRRICCHSHVTPRTSRLRSRVRHERRLVMWKREWGEKRKKYKRISGNPYAWSTQWSLARVPCSLVKPKNVANAAVGFRDSGTAKEKEKVKKSGAYTWQSGMLFFSSFLYLVGYFTKFIFFHILTLLNKNKSYIQSISLKNIIHLIIPVNRKF